MLFEVEVKVKISDEYGKKRNFKKNYILLSSMCYDKLKVVIGNLCFDLDSDLKVKSAYL